MDCRWTLDHNLYPIKWKSLRIVSLIGLQNSSSFKASLRETVRVIKYAQNNSVFWTMPAISTNLITKVWMKFALSAKKSPIFSSVGLRNMKMLTRK